MRPRHRPVIGRDGATALRTEEAIYKNRCIKRVQSGEASNKEPVDATGIAAREGISIIEIDNKSAKAKEQRHPEIG